ncbi:hypothetical protein GLOTRDRAFT_125643 [Gloeophyllum trabeum ATCC 11539]|uniref:C3H1-type domain-containing protein n=1 Tax=Gloeophyllum trabeum (strain ATCC 11539 / FP-39264 / Madison 617) TaxID=670483 RepID=S7QJ21_GLOTA|nr:uncharacterized protein GLOTRDRAFT_125643 [Gloeophyllum trabeum ATCC 11539]EPQ59338.1 hypothetical protein GLOTRDRAFT_125643 [Gloeophyllum trabeum ATCC 11539]
MADFLSVVPEVCSTYESRQFVVDKHLTQIRNEFVSLYARETEYRQRVEELTRDRDAFKVLYNSAEKSKEEMMSRLIADKKQAEREKVELNNQIMTLRGLENRVVCLIDGDGTIFAPSLLAQGREGGRAAARQLTESIHKYLSELNQFHEAQLWVYVFFNKSGLLGTLQRVGLRDEAQSFEEFMIGFNQAGERFLMVDVGNAKEAADAKIRVYLEDNIRMPQTWKLIFGGCHDNGYVTSLASAMTAGFREKLILLPGYTEMAAGIEELRLPAIKVPDLFMTDKMRCGRSPSPPGANPARSPSPPLNNTANTPSEPPGLPSLNAAAAVFVSSLAVATSVPLPEDTDDVAGTVAEPSKEIATAEVPAIGRPPLPSYKSALQSVQTFGSRPSTPDLDPVGSSGSSDSGLSSASKANPRRSSTLSAGRRVNSNIPLSKHDPPPCTLFYLASCKYGANCIYAHDYLLEDEHYATMRQNAKKSPCPAVNRNEICTFGDDCLYGHKCPMAPRCHFLKQGNCKFTGAGMHRDV